MVIDLVYLFVCLFSKSAILLISGEVSVNFSVKINEVPEF